MGNIIPTLAGKKQRMARENSEQNIPGIIYDGEMRAVFSKYQK
jgi:hypothetical protein